MTGVVCLWPCMTNITCFIIPLLCHKTARNKPALFAARNYSYILPVANNFAQTEHSE